MIRVKQRPRNGHQDHFRPRHRRAEGFHPGGLQRPADPGPRAGRCHPDPRGVADDLKKLPHVSPAIEKQLNDLGIFHYWQLAAMGQTDADRVGEEVGLPGRVKSWIEQSQKLTADAEAA